MTTEETKLREDLVSGVQSAVQPGHRRSYRPHERSARRQPPADQAEAGELVRAHAPRLVIMDFNGKRVNGPSNDKTTVLEWPIHTAVYQARPDVQSVPHVNPVDSTLIAALDIEMEPLTRETMSFAQGVPSHDSLEALLYHRV